MYNSVLFLFTSSFCYFIIREKIRQTVLRGWRQKNCAAGTKDNSNGLLNFYKLKPTEMKNYDLFSNRN